MVNLICPVCAADLSLTPNQQSLHCPNGHLFDRARQGYVNLLLSQHKKTKHPGDSSAMVAARSQFLNAGHYQQVAQRVAQSIAEVLALKPVQHYCDIGCGEGYYTVQFQQFLADQPGLSPDNSTSVATGIDISSPAIKAASQRSKSIQWLIASATRIPLATASQDLATCLFFRLDAVEVARILKPGATLITVSTGPRHLLELRTLLYDQLKPDSGPGPLPKNSLLKQLKTQSFEQTITLHSTREIEQLLEMTPHSWRVKPENKRRLSALTTLALTLDLRINCFQKVASAAA